MLFSYKSWFILGLVFIVLQATLTNGMERGRSQSPKKERSKSPPKSGGSGGVYYTGNPDHYKSGDGKPTKDADGSSNFAHYSGSTDQYKSKSGNQS